MKIKWVANSTGFTKARDAGSIAGIAIKCWAE